MEDRFAYKYDPAGLACSLGSYSGGSTGSTDTVESTSRSTRAEDVAVSGRVADPPGDDRTVRVTGGMASALQELQTRNAMLLEAVEEKNRQVQELGTLVESLEPVPGLDPAAFYAILRGGGGPGNEKDLDYRDQKIVHLAKRTRALNARLEGEKARCLKARREADVLATELESCRRQLELVSSAGARLAAEKGQRIAGDSSSIAQVDRVSGKEDERLRQQVVLLRTKLQEAQDEVKTCRRALSKEVGGANSRSLIDESGWKGRAQQIILLKSKVKQLEAQLRKDGQDRGRNDAYSQAQERIIMERQRSRAMEQLEGKINVLHEEADALRNQVLAKGARVAGLEKANGRIRDRVKMLQQKSDADDRLVDALRNEVQVRDQEEHRDLVYDLVEGTARRPLDGPSPTLYS